MLIVLVCIQFIRPTKNKSANASPNDITSHYDIPDSVLSVLKKSCYDCHSNNTIYPWYFNIQPVAWWMADHINEAKDNLNFSEFRSYKAKKQIKKLHGVASLVEKKKMPLDSYLWIHKYAKLDEAQIKLVVDWSKALQAKISADSNVVVVFKDEKKEKD